MTQGGRSSRGAGGRARMLKEDGQISPTLLLFQKWRPLPASRELRPPDLRFAVGIAKSMPNTIGVSRALPLRVRFGCQLRNIRQGSCLLRWQPKRRSRENVKCYLCRDTAPDACAPPTP